MDTEAIMALLPDQPRKGMTQAALSANSREFGKGYMIYHREAIREDTIPLRQTMDPEDWKAYFQGIRYHWAASCTCAECGETLTAGWSKGGRVNICEGPDGTAYNGIPSGVWDDDPYLNTAPLSSGDTLVCPFCDDTVTLIRQSSLRQGRNFQLMAGSVEAVGEYTAVLFWLLSRRLGMYGWDQTTAYPCAAVVIDRDGKLYFFSHARFVYGGKLYPDGQWKPCGALDPFQARYHSYEAVNHTKVGGWMWPNVRDTAGLTGEKTGLAEYVRDGGTWPLHYLTFWRKYPAVENVVKSGWTEAVDGLIEAGIDRERFTRSRARLFPDGLEELLDWSAVRPCGILGMSRKAAGKGRVWKWDGPTLALWRELLMFGCAAPEDAEDFHRYLTEYGY